MGAPIIALLLAVASSNQAAAQNAAVATNLATPAAITTQAVRAAQPIQPAAFPAPQPGSTDRDVHIAPVDISGAFEAKMLELSG
ncbi:MAG: hypothetical protein JOY86_05030 [Candidatus Eremiobacteraeota bacterium]|nr:hypothetical protein [Candidatus Eremiobacteraeota bacterium]